jgi:hypothetical protein
MTSRSCLEFNVIQILQDGAAPLNVPQDKIGLLDAGMGEWNMGKGA